MSTRRSFALVFGALIVVFVIASLSIAMVVRGRLIDAVDTDLENSIQGLVAAVDQLDIDLGLSFEIEANERAVFIFDGRTEVLFIPAGPVADPLPRPDVSASSIIARLGEPFDAVADGGVDYRVISARLADGRYLAIAEPLDGARDAIEALSRGMLVLLISVIVALGIVFLVIMRASLKPYEDMIETLEQIAAGDMTRRTIDDHSDPFMRRLAGSVNEMLDQVETSFEAKESAEERMRQFIADASHELRTPLTSIRGYAELYLSGTATDPASIDKQMSRINSESERMGRLVEELLTLARLDDQQPLRSSPVDLAAIVNDAVADARAAAPSRPISLDAPGQPELVHGDADALHQVIVNLLANTRIHTPDGTRVTVTLSGETDAVRLTIADDGPGMDPEVAARVFDRFFRADKARARQAGSTGLGMPIASGIVESHGGTIRLDTQPGRGARFTIRLPRSGDRAQ